MFEDGEEKPDKLKQESNSHTNQLPWYLYIVTSFFAYGEYIARTSVANRTVIERQLVNESLIHQLKQELSNTFFRIQDLIDLCLECDEGYQQRFNLLRYASSMNPEPESLRNISLRAVENIVYNDQVSLVLTDITTNIISWLDAAQTKRIYFLVNREPMASLLIPQVVDHTQTYCIIKEIQGMCLLLTDKYNQN